jgi:predicted nuclease of predicted toxin-antitoxin system
VKLFIDECLSPELAKRLNETGVHDAVHPRDYGRLGEPDHIVLRRCLDEDRTIVTQNARDFRNLVGRADVHPGLIILPAVGRERSWLLLNSVLEAVAARGEPAHVMINRVAEISASSAVQFFDLPPDAR